MFYARLCKYLLCLVDFYTTALYLSYLTKMSCTRPKYPIPWRVLRDALYVSR